MFLRRAIAFGFLAAACEAPTFSITNVTADPCATQTQVQGKTCGGACPACQLGESCGSVGDCASGVCTAGTCVSPATCDDSSKNGDETDIDCGGSCPVCAVNQHCAKNADCQTLVCADICQPANCTDGVRNGSESGTDCGGSCAACATGASCNTGSDCASGNCSNGTCLVASCSDELKNGDETDIDCGGSCSPCTTREACAKAADCDSLSCVSKACVAASCTDGILNGTEADTDCGPGCSACKAGSTCKANTDCATALCTSGYCLPTMASGGVLVTTGWQATASASTSNSTPNAALDSDLSTRWSSGTRQVPGMYFELDMQKPQIFFGFSLDSADSPGDAPGLFDVYLSLDGTFTKAALSAQIGAPTTTVEFGSAQIARYIKIVLTQEKSPNWWGIREMTVNY